MQSGRQSATLHLALVGDPAGPHGVATVAAARRGGGDVVLFARADDRTGWLRYGSRWVTQPELSGLGPIRAASHGDGSVSGFLVADSGRLGAVNVTLTDEVVSHEYDIRARRVFDATTGPGGYPVVALEAEDGQLLCGPPDQLRPVGLAGASAAAVTANQWGELVCVALDSWQGRLAVAETLGGEWDRPEWEPAPPDTRDVACVGHPGGVAVALATDNGLLIRPTTDTPDWLTAYAGKMSRVVALLGAGWRIQIAAVAGQRIVFGEEAATEWAPGAVTEVH